MTSSQTAGPFCPIYREAVEAMAWRNASSAHAGLLFDKFADAWWHDPDWSFAFDKGNRSKKDRDKAEHEKEGHWLKSQFPRRYTAPGSLLEEACARQLALAEKLGGRVMCLKNTERFVTGMGREHPLENGFLWHHTLGVPYLPGSSVKGMLRAWLREENGQIDPDHRGRDCWKESAWLREQFGTKGRAGRVVLLDMLPTQPPQLEVDVMTPHYAPYYQKQDGNEIPGDWHSPLPITFLTVAAGCSWQIGIIPADNAPRLTNGDLTKHCDALLEAIEVSGAGAKTAVGYGRFERDTVAEERLRREAEEKLAERVKAEQRAAERAAFEASIANDSEPLRQLKKLQREQNWQRAASDQNMISALQQFTEKHRKPPQDCLDWIRAWLESIPNYRGVWQAPEATKGKARNPKPKYSSKLIRELVKRLNPQWKR